jgi:hypothetical protein
MEQTVSGAGRELKKLSKVDLEHEWRAAKKRLGTS